MKERVYFMLKKNKKSRGKSMKDKFNQMFPEVFPERCVDEFGEPYMKMIRGIVEPTHIRRATKEEARLLERIEEYCFNQ